MPVSCKLCNRQLTRSTTQIQCECGWVMDEWCNESHQEWRPKHGDSRWLGTVEF